MRSIELWCAIAHLRISRFRVWSFGPSRNDGSARMPGTRPGMTTSGILQQLPDSHRSVGHAVGETPFIVVPGHHPHQRAVLHLGLVLMERGRVRVVVEVDRDVRR